MKKLSLLLLLFMAALQGFAQTTNISTGIDASGVPYVPGSKDMTWKLVSPSPVTPNPWVINPPHWLWQPTPVSGSNAQWIGGNGALQSQAPGDYIFERIITAPAGKGMMALEYALVYDDVLQGIELINPAGVAVNLLPTFVQPTKPYFIGKTTTHIIKCPARGEWKLRVKVKFIDAVGGLLLAGKVTFSGQCPPKVIKISKGIDAFNHQLNPTMNRSTFVSNAITNWTYQGTPAVTSSVIQFDPASYPPAGSTIVSAKLYLNENIAPSNGTLSTGGHTAYTAQTKPSGFVIDAISTPWNITTVSWATKPSIAPLTGFLAGYANAVPPCTGCVGLGTDNIIHDVTKIVQYQMSMGNYGFNLKFADENPSLFYRSRWFGSFESSKAPVLVITYY